MDVGTSYLDLSPTIYRECDSPLSVSALECSGPCITSSSRTAQFNSGVLISSRVVRRRPTYRVAPPVEAPVEEEQPRQKRRPTRNPDDVANSLYESGLNDMRRRSELRRASVSADYQEQLAKDEKLQHYIQIATVFVQRRGGQLRQSDVCSLLRSLGVFHISGVQLPSDLMERIDKEVDTISHMLCNGNDEYCFPAAELLLAALSSGVAVPLSAGSQYSGPINELLDNIDVDELRRAMNRLRRTALESLSHTAPVRSPYAVPGSEYAHRRISEREQMARIDQMLASARAADIAHDQKRLAKQEREDDEFNSLSFSPKLISKQSTKPRPSRRKRLEELATTRPPQQAPTSEDQEEFQRSFATPAPQMAPIPMKTSTTMSYSRVRVPPNEGTTIAPRGYHEVVERMKKGRRLREETAERYAHLGEVAPGALPSPQKRPDGRRSSFSQPTVILDVQISAAQSVKLIVSKGDHPQTLARRFALQNALTKAQEEKLADAISQELRGFAGVAGDRPDQWIGKAPRNLTLVPVRTEESRPASAQTSVASVASTPPPEDTPSDSFAGEVIPEETPEREPSSSPDEVNTQHQSPQYQSLSPIHVPESSCEDDPRILEQRAFEEEISDITLTQISDGAELDDGGLHICSAMYELDVSSLVPPPERRPSFTSPQSFLTTAITHLPAQTRVDTAINDDIDALLDEIEQME